MTIKMGYGCNSKKPHRVAFVNSFPIGGGRKIQKFKLRGQSSKSEG